MASILRGEIYYAELGPGRGHEQTGDRPVVVLSHDIFNERSRTVIVMAITSRAQRAGFPLTWRVPAGRLPKDSWIKISQVYTLSSDRLQRQLGRLEEDELNELTKGLNQLIG